MTSNTEPGSSTALDPTNSSHDLGESEHGFRQLVETLPDAILVHCDGTIVYVNPFCVQLHGAASPEQLIGRDISELIKPEFLCEVKKRIEDCCTTGMASPPLEVVGIACDGSTVDIEAVAIPMSWNGKPAIEVVLRDIRKRKQAEAAVHAWHKRLELAEKTGLRLGLWDWDLVANTVVWSKESYRQFGCSPNDFSGRVEDAVCRIHPQDRPRVEQTIQSVLAGETEEYSAQYRLVHPDGTICWIDAHGVMVRNGSTHMIGIGVDITELKSAEQSIRDSEKKYRDMFENATYGIFLSKPDGSLLDVNPSLVAMLGYSSKEDLLTCNLDRDVYEDPKVRKTILAGLYSGGRIQGAEVNWKRRDGKIITVRVNGGAFAGIDGSIDHYEVMVEDRTEQRTLEEQFRRSQKMEAVALLAGGISHDFNNLLAVILGNTDLLLEKNQSGPAQHYAQQIKKAGESAAQMVRQLLTFSRKQLLYPAVLDVNTVIDEVVKILKRLIGEDVRIEVDLKRDLASVRADRGQVEQILMNLATNARDAMPSGGTLTIRTNNAEVGQSEVALHPYIKPGTYVHIMVSDTGVGMTEEVRNRIFEPFFTTKDKGRGTGLGLATVYGIVKQSGGYIWVFSRPESGTTFDIFLPQVKEKAAPLLFKPQSRGKYPKGTETVLVLEDDDALRQITAEFLTASGYNVLQAGRGYVAIDLCAQYKGRISLVVSDVVLPEMDGPSAVRKLQLRHPEMKVLYVSGYTDAPVAQQLNAEGAILLQKPVSRMDLLKKVDEVLH